MPQHSTAGIATIKAMMGLPKTRAKASATTATMAALTEIKSHVVLAPDVTMAKGYPTSYQSISALSTHGGLLHRSRLGLRIPLADPVADVRFRGTDY